MDLKLAFQLSIPEGFFEYLHMNEKLDFSLTNSPNQKVWEFGDSGISLFLKREDLIHPVVSGNKFRKLKYNLREALQHNKSTLLSFGGAYSNHISAVAAAGKIFAFKTIGIIRGEELGEDKQQILKENSTLQYAAAQGMQFKFISRKEYKEKATPEFLKRIENEFADFYLIPEGGTNLLAIKGCEEILSETDKEFDIICCPVGTGGTISGIINSSGENQQVIGFSALKGDFLKKEISKFTTKNNWNLNSDYTFGGYGKISSDLVTFINRFRKQTGVQLDPIYTGKMIFGIFDMIEKAVFPRNSRILAVHTGGLQGISGMNKLLLKKNLPLIELQNEL